MTTDVSQKRKKGRFWEWLFPILSVIIGVTILYVAQYGVAIAFVICRVDYTKYEGAFTTIYAIIAITLLLIYSKMSRVFYSDFKSGLLIKKPGTLDVVSTIIIAIGLLGIVSIYMMVVSIMAEQGGDSSVVAEQLEEYETNVDRYSEIAVETVPFFDKFLDYIGIAILVPIAEELLFRGVILGQLLKKYPAALAILASATIFGLMHGISVHIGYALISGIIIGCVYYFTSNIAMSTLIHMIFNFFGGTLSLIFTDGWFSIPEKITDSILITCAEVEIVMITPATIFFIILFARKLKENKALKEDSSEETEVVLE